MVGRSLRAEKGAIKSSVISEGGTVVLKNFNYPREWGPMVAP